jgi:hypothetical protein
MVIRLRPFAHWTILRLLVHLVSDPDDTDGPTAADEEAGPASTLADRPKRAKKPNLRYTGKDWVQ